MRRIRKIYFQNAAGERYGLNGQTGVYASDLSGLGVTLSPSYADLGSGFFIPVSDESEPQGSCAFTMTFTRTPYQEYQDLVNWLASAEAITLVYIPTGDQEYYREVTLNYLQKGELNAVGWLEVPASFTAITPWYLPTPASLTLLTADADESKRYPYKYTPSLRYGVSGGGQLSGLVVGSGHVPGALDLRYYGGITNPKIRLTGNITGKTYGICSVTAEILPTDTLLFSSRRRNSYIAKVAADGTETDLLDALDLSTTPFFRLPVNETCTLSIEADAPFSGRAELLIYYYFRSV